jgi:hypothetical protein
MVDRETRIRSVLFYKIKLGFKSTEATCKIRQVFEEDVIFDRKAQFDLANFVREINPS